MFVVKSEVKYFAGNQVRLVLISRRKQVPIIVLKLIVFLAKVQFSQLS